MPIERDDLKPRLIIYEKNYCNPNLIEHEIEEVKKKYAYTTYGKRIEIDTILSSYFLSEDDYKKHLELELMRRDIFYKIQRNYMALTLDQVNGINWILNNEHN